MNEEINGILNGTYRPSISLVGKLKNECSIVGMLKADFKISGVISKPLGYEDYNGSYEVVPSSEDQTLFTKDKHMTDNVSVKQIPFYEVSNPKGGVTAIIG